MRSADGLCCVSHVGSGMDVILQLSLFNFPISASCPGVVLGRSRISFQLSKFQLFPSPVLVVEVEGVVAFDAGDAVDIYGVGSVEGAMQGDAKGVLLGYVNVDD